MKHLFSKLVFWWVWESPWAQRKMAQVNDPQLKKVMLRGIITPSEALKRQQELEAGVAP